MDAILDSVLDRPVQGVNLVPGRLREQLGPATELLVFLRHFGCMFCREAVSDLRAAVESDDDFPRVLFFAQASTTEVRAFLRRYWPSVRVVADPGLEFYDAFGVDRASFLQALGPQVLSARARARDKGHENGPRSGDIWRLPGIFAVRDGRIVWSYKPRHAADHPDFATIPAQISAARAAAS